jgi:thymidylate synthase (FAD)
MTYDLEVDHPAHNFVANGFVTHNSQVSQRYVSGKTLRFVERPEFQRHDVLHERFCARVDSLAREYDEIAGLLMESMSKQLAAMPKTDARKAVNQAARAVLPNETEAPIVVTGNVRAWRHFCEMRGSKHAEPEIRSVAAKVLRCLAWVAPALFSDYKAREMDDGSIEIGTDWFKV